MRRIMVSDKKYPSSSKCHARVFASRAAFRAINYQMELPSVTSFLRRRGIRRSYTDRRLPQTRSHPLFAFVRAITIDTARRIPGFFGRISDGTSVFSTRCEDRRVSQVSRFSVTAFLTRRELPLLYWHRRAKPLSFRNKR